LIAAGLAAFLVATGCSRPAVSGPERIAVLPASVLVADPASEWLAAAVPVVLQQDLATSHSSVVTFVPSLSSAYQIGATTVLRPLVEARGNAYTFRLTRTDAATQQESQHWVEQASSSEQAIAALDRLAKRVDSAASAFSSRSFTALHFFSLAILAPDPARRTANLTAAIQADPAFGLAYIAALENNTGSSTLPTPQAQSFTSLDRARWQAVSSRRAGASAQERVKEEKAVLQLAPNNVEAIELLGSALFETGEVQAGERWMRRAMELNPADQTLPLRLVQKLVAAGQFSRALEVLNPIAQSNGNLLPSVALLQLLAGKTQDANATFARFLNLIPAHSAPAQALQAQWERYKTAATEQLAPSPVIGSAPLQLPDFADPNGPALFANLRRALQRK
jgi:tetratricopeptide (TPR) repeat protein